MQKMHANLMRAAGMDLRLDERGVIQFLHHAVAGMRGAAVIVVVDGHAFAVRGMARNRGVDFATFARHFAADDGLINLFYDAAGKLFRKREVRLVVFGDDEAAAGFLVEPVHNAGPRHAADAAQRTGAMVQQSVDERVFLVPGGGMHDEAGGFVDDEQRFVLEQNIQRNVLRLRLGGAGFGKRNLNRVADARVVRGLGRLAIDANMALFDEALHRAARDGGEFFAQKNVQAFAAPRLFDREFFRGCGHRLASLILINT